MKNKNNLILSVIAIGTLLITVIGATFAYFASVSNTDDNVVVNAQLNPNNSSFTVEAAELAINVAPSLMIETQASTEAKVSNTANLVVTYNSGGPELTCTYDIVFYWDNQYTKSTSLPLTTNKGTWNYEMSLKSTATAADSSNASTLSETNMDWANGTVLHTGETIYSNGNDAVNTYSYTLSFYNLDTDQSGLIKNNATTSYGSHLAVENINCTAGKLEEPTLASHIKSLVENRDESKSWQVINENGYRYEGKEYYIADNYKNSYTLLSDLIILDMHEGEYYLDYAKSELFDYEEAREQALKDGAVVYSAVDNWICLDEACAVPYRIIGVFEETYTDSNNELKTGELVKIVRAEQNAFVQYWNTTASNNWSTATLKTALNATTGSAEQNVYANLSNEAKNIVVKARWHLGNVVYDNSTVSQLYLQERNTESSNLQAGNPPYVDEYVGLIYPSDYGYGSLSSECRNAFVCNYENWLYIGDNIDLDLGWWTISPTSVSNLVNCITQREINSYYHVSFNRIVRESMYLHPNTKFTGTGSQDDPFYAFI